MNTPGVSLFQGAESIKVNTSLERAEEEEALKDQKRRNEELGDLLQNAFDDLDDDETTIDSTTNFQSDILLENKNNDNHNPHRQQQEETWKAEVHQLKMMLDSRTHELENIKQVAHDEYKRRDELQKRLSIAEAELDRALATKKNTHELLVESKEKCSNLESTIAKQRSDKKHLEGENNELLGKLETAQTLLADVQRKYDMVERDLNKHNDRNAEMRRKQMEERHRAEIEMMQQQMEQLANKLDKKSNDLENMNTRYHALQSSHELMLVDKTTTINDLNNALDEAQRKCEELRSKQDYFQENVRLQKLVANLQDQIQAMEKTIRTLNERLEFTTAELDVMDSVLHQHNLEDSPRRLSQTQGKVVGSTPLNTIDRVGNLKDELYRALANLKSKRDEIRKLHQSVEEKNHEIRSLRDEENRSLVQITTLKEDKMRLENRLKIIEQEFEQMGNKTKSPTKSLNNTKIQIITDELKRLREEKEHLERERIDHECERRKWDAQLKNVEVDLEELKQEHESMKLNYEQILKENQNLRSRNTADQVRLELEKHKFVLKDSQKECDRLKNLYVEIANEKEALGYEMEKLQKSDHVKELQEQREKVASLQRSLQLAEVKSSELMKILETEKLCHERDIKGMREKIEKEKSNNLKASKENSNNCTKCIDHMAEITKFEIEILKLSNINSISKQEIDELTEELNESKCLIEELSEKLKLSEHQENLIKELKTKAHRFEEYIKSQSESQSSSSDKSPPSASSDDKGIGTSPELERSEIKKIESRIREEMAKIFANELKRFQLQVRQTEEKSVCLQREYQHISSELQQRNAEVDLLKQAILAERERLDEILKHKDAECKDIVQKQNVMLHKCRDELQGKNQKIAELAKELGERQTQIEAERKSMKAVMSQWEEQRKNVDAIERVWQEQHRELRKTHEAAIVSWQTKYNSAKRTAANYKRYAEDKEAHMLKEYERIKYEYDASLAKIEVRMKETLEKKNREMKDAIAANDKKRPPLSHDKENKASN